MFCPQCGQQQLSHEVRFCSRCGFPLNVVSEVLATGGALPARVPDGQQVQHLSPRQRGVRQGAMLMLSSMLVVPLVIFVLVEMLGAPEELIPLAGIICVIGGLMRILYAVFFESKTPAGAPHQALPYAPAVVHAQMRRPEPDARTLPPPQSMPVPTYAPPRSNTSEIAPPPSVTDHTTRLLRDETDAETR